MEGSDKEISDFCETILTSFDVTEFILKVSEIKEVVVTSNACRQVVLVCLEHARVSITKISGWLFMNSPRGRIPD